MLFVKLLEQLRRQYRRAKRIVLIVDNYVIHKSQGTQRWLAENPYASGEYRLREWAGLSERARSGLGTGVVSADQGSTNADVGDEAEGGVGVARGGIATAAAQRGGETAHCGGELPQRGVGFGGGAAPRCSHQCVVP